jgi:hypothetical protein
MPNRRLPNDRGSQAPRKIPSPYAWMDRSKLQSLRDLYIFQGKVPGDLAADREAVSGNGAPPAPVHLLARIGSPPRARRRAVRCGSPTAITSPFPQQSPRRW